MASQPVQAVLYRILGNDLPPRYSPGQTLANLRFTLEHEDELPGLEKRWLLNRIVDPQVQQELQRTIEAAGQRCDLIPFRAEEYRQAWTDLGAIPPECHPWSETFQELSPLEQARIADYIGRAKNLYLMNNNGARNRALELGFADAEWVLPWDGGCFLPAWAWPELQEAMQRSDLRYLCIPMHRLTDLNHLPTAADQDQLPVVEPQLAFARQAAIRFDEQLRYGSGPKWQVLQRIGLPGPWQHTPGWLPWESVDTTPAPDAGAFLEVGLVLRLSGEAQDDRYVEESALWRLRFASILRFTRRIDHDDARISLARHSYRCWRSFEHGGMKYADDALRSLVGIKAAESSQMDPPWERICWLTLDAALNRSLPSQVQALELVHFFCIDPVSAWSPRDLPLDRVAELGVFHPLLDAFTLLQELQCFTLEQSQALHRWCSGLLDWLCSDSRDFLNNNHSRAAASWHHLLILSVAAFLKQSETCCQVFDNLPGLLCSQYQSEGKPCMLNASSSEHGEQQSNLLAWLQLEVLSASLGRDIMGLRAISGYSLKEITSMACLDPGPNSLDCLCLINHSCFCRRGDRMQPLIAG